MKLDLHIHFNEVKIDNGLTKIKIKIKRRKNGHFKLEIYAKSHLA